MGIRVLRVLGSIVGSGTIVAVAAWKFSDGKNRVVHASWTTNFVPSVAWDYNWDRRNLSSTVKPVDRRDISGVTDENANVIKDVPKPTASRHLILIRHGQYEMNGRTDAERTLTPLGKEQADATGLRLKQLGFHYSTIYHSTMKRAEETAKIISQHLPDVPLESCELCREGAPIPPEPPVGHWRPEAQQFFEDGARIEAAFRKYFHRADVAQTQDSYNIIVCHANVIRYWICRVLQFPPEAWLRLSLNNCSLTWVCIRPSGRVTLRSLSDSGHMSVGMVTAS